MSLPSGAEELVTEILRGKDLTKTSLKEVRGELESRLKLQPGALDSCREEVKQITTAEIARIQEEQAAAADLEGGAEECDEEDSAGVAAPEPAAAASSAASPGAARVSKAPAKTKGKKRAAEESAEALRGQEGAAGGKGKSKGPGTKERQKSLMSRKKFMEIAKPLKVTIGDKNVTLAPKVFSTNSVGFCASSKVSTKVGDQEVMLQCGMNFTIIGSKEWAEE